MTSRPGLDVGARTFSNRHSALSVTGARLVRIRSHRQSRRKSPAVSSGRRRNSACAPLRCIRRRMRMRSSCRWRTRPGRSGRPLRPNPICASTGSSMWRCKAAHSASIPDTVFSSERAEFRRGLRRERHRLHWSARLRHQGDGPQGCREGAGAEGGRARRAGLSRLEAGARFPAPEGL